METYTDITKDKIAITTREGEPEGGVGGRNSGDQASRPAGRRANPPEADIVGNSTSVEWGRSGVKSDLGVWRCDVRKASLCREIEEAYPFNPAPSE